MNDAKELRELVKNLSSKPNVQNEELSLDIEKAADMLISACKAALEKACEDVQGVFKGAQEICFYFTTISNDFTQFVVGSILKETEKDYVKRYLEEDYGPLNYRKYVDLEFSVNHSQYPISGLDKQNYGKLLLLKKALKKRGFLCCTTLGWRSIYFTVVFELE